MKIAVIGAGIFGCVIAEKLAGAHDVCLFEREESILSGSTFSSVLRVHKGAHYPRDILTAQQSISGYRDFCEEFQSSIVTEFTNYYALASHGSKVTTDEFERFLRIVGIPNRRVGNRGELERAPVRQQKIASLYEIAEAVIDEDSLRHDLARRLDVSGVHLCCSTEILSANLRGTNWHLADGFGKDFGPFDYVIRATYGMDRIRFESGNPPIRSLEYHRTLVLDVKLGLQNFGLTVVDGDFLTILPKGRSNRHLVYAPSLSVMEKSFGSVSNFQTSLEQTQISTASHELVRRLRDWLPEVPSNADLDVKPITGLRAIMPAMEATDRRTTEVVETGPRFIDVLSGKIDHSIQAARECQRIISG